MIAKRNSRDRERVVHFGGKAKRDQHLMEVVCSYMRAHFFTGSTPQFVPVTRKHNDNHYVLSKRESDIYSCWK